MELAPQGAVRRHRHRGRRRRRRAGGARRAACSWSSPQEPTADAHPQRRTGARAAGAGHDLRGRPARRAAEREGARARPTSRRSSSAGCVAAGLPVVEATSFVHPKWVPQLADAAELMTDARRRSGRDLPVLVPNERGLDRALELGCRHIAIFGQRHRDVRAAQPQPQPRRAVRDVRADRAPGARRRARRPRLRLDVLRRPVGGRRAGRRRWSRSASGSSTSAPASSASATPSASAPPATSQRCSTASSTPGMPVDQLAMHFHDTYGQALANAHAALRGRRHHLRRQRRRPRRLPVRRERHRQPRHRGPGVDAARPRHRDRRRPRAGSSPPASGWPGSSAGPARRPWSARWPVGHLRQNRRHEPTSSTCTSGRRRPARPTSRTGSPCNRPALAEHDVHFPTVAADQPGPVPLPAALDLLDQDWGGAPGHATGELGRAGRSGYAAARARSSSATRSSPPATRRAGRAGDERPRRQRGPRRLLRARPRPAAAGGLAGEHQAGPQLAVPQVPPPDPGAGAPRRGPWFWRAFRLPAVLGTWGARPAARADPPRHRAAAAAAPRRRAVARASAAPFGIDPAWAPLDSDARQRLARRRRDRTMLRQLNRRLGPAARARRDVRRR